MVVLLTGATGFVGSALLRRLRDSGFDRENKIVCLSSEDIPGWQCIKHRGWRFTKADIAAVVGSDIDVVVHLGAATPHTPDDFAPKMAAKFAMNVRNTCWLYENLPSRPRKIVFISTTDVYGSAHEGVCETTQLSPASMYGASKIMCEEYLRERAQRDCFLLDVLRLGPVYGEGEETYSKIVSTFVAKVAADETIQLRGTGEETRCLLHVDDCCGCIIHAMMAEYELPIVNVASGNVVSIRRIIDIIAKEFGKEAKVETQKGYTGRSDSFDAALAKKVFGNYERSLEDGIRGYVSYFCRRFTNANL